MLSYFQIISELQALCKARQSGTLFIKTQDNKSARFSLEEGDIVGCCYRQSKGYDALPQILAIESGTVSFNDHGPLGTEHPVLPKTAELLAMLTQKDVSRSLPSSGVRGLSSSTSAKSGSLNSKNDVIFSEMSVILTEYVGPMASVLFSGYANEKDKIMSDVVDFEQMIDDIAGQIGNPKESEEFKTRILDMVNSHI